MLQPGRDPRVERAVSTKALDDLSDKPSGAFVVFGRLRGYARNSLKLAKSTLLSRGTVLVTAALLISGSVLLAGFKTPATATAAPSTYLNFQARILNSTGNLVADGSYNIEFKLYKSLASGGSAQGVCVGGVTDDCEWVETRSTVNVVNGYFSVNLGSTTAFGAGIDWSAQHWLTMRVGGTGAPSWDPEMSPRIQMTAIPLAFVANNVNSGNTTGSSNNTVLQSGNSTTSGTSGTVTLQSGTTASGNTGNVTIDSGSATGGTAGQLLFGNTYASLLQMGRSGAVSTLIGSTINLNSATIATNASALTLFDTTVTSATLFSAIGSSNTLNIADAATTKTIDLGGVTNGGTDTINIATNSTGADIISVGSTNTSSTLLVTGGTSNLSLNNTSANLTATTINLTGNVILPANKFLTITGASGTANRPSSPTNGMIFYDTSTNQLLVYDSTLTKWKADHSAVTKIVAASNSSQAVQDSADYITDGTDDQVQINAALTAATGGVVYLAEGTYTTHRTASGDATIFIPNNTTLIGAGKGTIVKLGNLDVTENLIENTDQTTGTGITIGDLLLDGDDTSNTAGTQAGIYLNGMGDGSGSGARTGGRIQNVNTKDFRNAGIWLNNSDNNVISGTIHEKGNFGIYLNSSTNNTLTGNTAQGNAFGISLDNTSNYNTVTGNTTEGNSSHGLTIDAASNYNTLTGNTAKGNSTAGIHLNASIGNVMSGNTLTGNGGFGIQIDAASNRNAVSGNIIFDNGSAGSNNGIVIAASDANIVSGNQITDSSCTTNCYAISISSGTVNYLADNRYSVTAGTDQATINDAGTGTIYASQLTPAQILQSSSSLFKAIASSSLTGTGAIAVTTALTGTSTKFTTELQEGDKVTVNGETRTVVTITSDTAVVVDVAFTTTASSQTITRLPAELLVRNSAAINTLNLSSIGEATFRNSTNSTTAFRIQNAAGSSLFNVDTANSNLALTGAVTAANLMDITADSLTTGKALDVTSSSTALTSGSLVYVSSATTGALATNGIVSINATGNYTSTSNVGLLNVTANSTAAGTVQNIDANALTTGVGLRVASTGTGLTSGSLLSVSSATTGDTTSGIVRLSATGNYSSSGFLGLLYLAANSTQSGTVQTITANALTSGRALMIDSTGTGLTTGSLLYVRSATTGALSTTGIVSLSATGNYTTSTLNAGLFNLFANATTAGTIQNIQGNALTTGVGLRVASTGTGLTTGSLIQVSTATTGAVATNGVVNIAASGNYTSTSNIGLLSVLANSTAAGTIQNIQGNALTTGQALYVSSTGTGLTSGSLLYVTSATTGAVATNGIASLNATGNFTSTSNAGLLNVQANATTAGTVANLSGTAVTTGTVLQVTGGTGTTTGFTLNVTNGRSQFTPTSTIASAAGAVWDGFNVAATTATLTGSTGVTTATGFNLFSIAAPTITDASAVTVTNAATLYVGGAPIASGSATITNPYALLIDSGTARFNGEVVLSTVSGGGLSTCSNAITSKLLWDSTAKTFSCGTDQSGGSATLQAVYTASTGGTTSEIIMATTQGALDIQDRSTSNGGTLGGNLLNVRATAATDATAGAILFSIGSTGNILQKVTANSTTALQVQNLAGTNVLTVDTTNTALAVGSSAFSMFGARTDTSTGTGTQPNDVVTGDFDRDGDMDVATSDIGNNKMTIMLNTGSGSFATAVVYTGNTGPNGIAAGDYDRDGDTDIAVMNNGAAFISIFMNNGAGLGTFAAKVDYATISNGSRIIASDLDKDGDLDLSVTGPSGGTTIARHLNNGSGVFGVSASTTVGNSPADLTSADFDNDGDMDLAVTNFGSTSVSILLNTGAGSFATKVDYPLGTNPWAIASGDIDNDGYIDIAAVNRSDNTVSVYRNLGNGTFGAKVDYLTGTLPEDVTLADIDKDGDLDMATVSTTSATMNLYRNIGGGLFAPKVDFAAAADAENITAADIDKDGDIDLIAANNTQSSISVWLNNSLGVAPTTTPTLALYNNGYNDAINVKGTGNNQLIRVDGHGNTAIGGTTSLFSTYTDITAGSTPIAVANADLDGDGDIDMAVANSGGGSGLSVYINTGSGNFAAKVDYTTGSGPFYVVAADFEKDGDIDLAVVNSSSNTVSVFLNNGAGTFAAKADYTTGATPGSVAAADFDKDGDVDLAVANQASTGALGLSILLNNGAGTFAAKVDYTTGSGPFQVIATDFDKDGDVDLAIPNTNSATVYVYLNNGAGVFAAGVSYTTANTPQYAAFGDFDKDGDMDMAVTCTGNTVISVFINTGSGAFAAKVDYATGVSPRQLSVSDFDKDGILDMAVANLSGNSVSILSGTGTGTFAAKVDYAAGVSASGISAADIDSDGDTDLLTANSSSSTVSILKNTTYSPNRLSVTSEDGSTSLFSVASSGLTVNTASTFKGNLVISSQADATEHTFSATCGCMIGRTVGTFGAELTRDAITASVVYKGKLFVSTRETDLASVYRYDGNETWTRVTNATPGKAVTGDAATADEYSLAVYNGKLYIGSKGTASTAAIYSSSTADIAQDSFTIVNTTAGTFASAAQDGVSDMVVWNGNLYIATAEPNLAEIVRYDGGSVFTQVTATDGKLGAEVTADKDGFVLAVYREMLMAGGITGGTGAIVAAYQGNGTTWTALNSTTTGSFDTADTNMVDVTSMEVWNGALYVAVSKAAAAAVYVYRGTTPVSAVTTSFKRVNATVGKLGLLDTAFLSVTLKTYNGKLYAGSQTAGTAALYEYTGSIGTDWTQINTTRGTFGSQTAINNISSLVEMNGSLYVGIDDGAAGNAGAVYSWSKTANNSYALQFGSDTVGMNVGAISFLGGTQAAGNASHSGTFLFSHGIATTTGAYDLAEDYPTRDQSLVAGDIVSVDPAEETFVKRGAAGSADHIVGVYSTDPALRLSQADATINGARAIPVALAGRVPVKVSTENGLIEPGDAITLSPTQPGVGVKAIANGRIVGMSMGSYSGEGVGQVTVFVNPSYYSPTMSGLITGDMMTINGNSSLQGNVEIQGNVTVGGNLTVTGDTEVQELVINGKLTSKGDRPAISVPDLSVEQASLVTTSVDGTDTAGILTVTLAPNAAAFAANQPLEVKFHKAYQYKPVVIIGAVGRDTATVGPYLESADGERFIIYSVQSFQPGKTYKINYQVMQVLNP